MAKKKTEKDVLIVRDEKTGEISVVAGLNADGSPKRIPAKAENAQSFLQFDRHGDVLDNFFKKLLPAVQGTQPLRFLPCRGGPSRQAAGSYQGLAERPRGQQGDACAPQGGHLRLRKESTGGAVRRKAGTTGTETR